MRPSLMATFAAWGYFGSRVVILPLGRIKSADFEALIIVRAYGFDRRLQKGGNGRRHQPRPKARSQIMLLEHSSGVRSDSSSDCREKPTSEQSREQWHQDPGK